MNDKKEWRTYEEVAQQLLEQFADHFGLGRVEGKHVVPGSTGTSWEIDAKGIKRDGDGIVLIECRRHTKSKISQGEVGELAFRIIDTGAKSGIIVSPLELQKGAKLLAGNKNIAHVRLNADATTTEYMMKFLNNIFAGVREQLGTKDVATAEVMKHDNLGRPKASAQIDDSHGAAQH